MILREIIKVDSKTGKCRNLGFLNEDEVKIATRGYRWDGITFNRKGCRYFYIVNRKKNDGVVE